MFNFNEEDLKDHEGVAMLIMNGEGKVLVLDHTKLNCWTIPVGKVKHGQTLLEGLKEEAKEELGISPTYVIHEAWKQMDTEIRMGVPVDIKLHLYRIVDYTGNITNNEPEKHRDIKWMSLEELNELEYKTDAVKLLLNLTYYQNTN